MTPPPWELRILTSALAATTIASVAIAVWEDRVAVAAAERFNDPLQTSTPNDFASARDSAEAALARRNAAWLGAAVSGAGLLVSGFFLGKAEEWWLATAPRVREAEGSPPHRGRHPPRIGMAVGPAPSFTAVVSF